MATIPSRENAGSKLEHPTRWLIVGESRTGKTTLMVNVIKHWFAGQVNRAIIFCPTFERQRTYDPIRALFKPKDVYTKVNPKSIQMVMDQLEHGLKRAEATKTPQEKVLIVIDDMAGNSAIQGRRQGPFATLSVQTTHWNISLFVVSQEPTCCDPNFRNNAENITYFPSAGKCSFNWLQNTYTSLDMNKDDMKKIILLAQRGGRADNEERGRHFLYIYKEPGGFSRFFIDFNREIKVHVL